MTRASTPRGPVAAGERALAPDLARGFMLLFIVIANSTWYLWAAPMTGGNAHPAPEGPLDSFTQFLTIVMVDSRSYPMFAFLFGYGMVQLAVRQEAAGADPRAVDALLRRRNLWLLIFGFWHALLLWMGDVLGAYGLAGLLLCWLFFRRRDTTLLVWAGALAGLLLLMSAGSVTAMAAMSPGDAAGGFDMDFMASSIANPSLLWAAVGRVTIWPAVVLGQGLLGLAVPTAILLGVWAARRRILEEPERHLRLLRTVAVAGLATAWIGGLPEALAQLGIWELDEARAAMLALPHALTGLAGGLGYVALIALIARRLQARDRGPGVVLTALTATGKRSLTSYLGQSVLCAPILAAWGLGLGAHLTSWSMALFAVGVWLVTVAAAYAMERAGKRGPAEVLLRRLSYQRTTAAPAVPSAGRPPGPGDDQERTTR
ncbi:putative membrane protein YeiB [Nocardiopsis sp. Huas11]|uniref:DUF418 domain-containing protein n=1 Tax=Nocardiopsis sp. Huas11 TaxID=2183912 RepID=UPI000EB5209A|nr:DUF418 domain-containing protein [Nocardiopsis sp. Huas11]RKS04520.1 putative membrane protein YeiB [Nocardiopsis sp. Huas11]